MQITNGYSRGQSSLCWRPLAMILVAGACLSACDRKAGGQVLAVVGSQEITQQEIVAEAESNNVPAQGLQGATPALLERVVQRNLLADYAREQGLDRSPDYVTRRRLLEQTLLASLALKNIVGTPTNPSGKQVQDYIAANPTMFARRERLALDQVRFPTPSDPARIRALTRLGSLEAIEAEIKRQGGQATRGNTSVDTATLEPGVARQVADLPAGKMFDVSVNGVTFVSQVTARTPIATDPATWSGPAKSLIERQRAEQAVANTLKELRGKAKIQYDPSVQPKEAPKKAN